jgi:predicted cupin superfamily sugar epimerase
MGVRIRPTAGTVIAKLGLGPHPEGGHYRETWRADADAGGRPTATAILYLLAAGERSAWHRVDAAEVWLFHGGDPLELHVAPDAEAPSTRYVLGTEVVEAEQPQVVVPAGAWQSARTLGAWTLVSCVVSPGFRFEGFELPPPSFEPGRTDPGSRRGPARTASSRARRQDPR